MTAPRDTSGTAGPVDDDIFVRPIDKLTGPIRMVAAVVAVAFALFHLYTATFGVMDGIRQRVVHLGFALVLVFLMKPVLSGMVSAGPRRLFRFVDLLFIIVVVTGCGYLFIEDDALDARMGLVFTTDIILGVGVTIALLEATRRLTGIALPLVAITALGYAYFGPYLPGAVAHRGFTVSDITVTLFLTTEGIFGPPLAVSATYIILFIILGGVLQASGAGQFFSDIALSLFGRVRGGPAKVSVVGSSLFGMISGSAVANVSGTGVLTIPLMKRIGFDRRFAGAVEAVSSTGGQLMPPIMASAAFVIAEILGISYMEVAAAAAIPAALYFAALFVAIDLRAGKLGMRGQSKAELPAAGPTMRDGGYLLIVPIALVLLLAVGGYSPMRAAVYTIGINLLLFLFRVTLASSSDARTIGVLMLATVHAVAWVAITYIGHWPGLVVYAAGLVLAWLAGRQPDANPGLRMSSDFIEKVIVALRDGALGALEVAVCCATAGIVIGVFMLTGLGLRFSGILIDIAGGNLALLLVLTMFASLILGMGMPTIGAYIILAILVAPGLIELGVNPLAAHLFIFYFGVISCITPPVALAAYAAAAISGGSAMGTGITACRLGIAAFIIPFMMVYNSELVMQGTFLAIVLASLTALVGVSCLAAGLEGFVLARANALERIMLVSAGLVLIVPGIFSDMIGIALIAFVAMTQLRKRAALAASPPGGAKTEPSLHIEEQHP
ncbi:TRAP transporter fused permease subunit [Fodinicurvata sp. EGI_FJ10296]|uniref:TRAP transporter permease n=1 Tax=Fodinicurvata sp. EGI_FJ10296 TaxID=3231908 RepID=UPI0034523CEA